MRDFGALNPTMPTTNGIAFAIREKGPDDRPKSHKSRVNCRKRRIPSPSRLPDQSQATIGLVWILVLPKICSYSLCNHLFALPWYLKTLKSCLLSSIYGQGREVQWRRFLWLVQLLFFLFSSKELLISRSELGRPHFNLTINLHGQKRSPWRDGRKGRMIPL